MGYAARANRARRLLQLLEGTLAAPEGIVTTMTPHNKASREVVHLRMGGVLAVAMAVAASQMPHALRLPRLRQMSPPNSRRPSPTGRQFP